MPVCEHDWKTTHWDKVLCELEWIGLYKHQVVCQQKCNACKEARRVWYGIDHKDRELKSTLYTIKPKKYPYWDKYIKQYTLISSDGALAVRAQKTWDGIPLKFIGLQRVQI
ncbi:MAG: hypothetical protein K0Q50_727 [Vampirovibrio sp.]|nr:hypothetical protein [Vampirovibrio sp.]